MKQCQQCKGTENLFVNSKRTNKEGETVFSYMCRKCNTERVRQFRKTDAGRAAVKRAVTRYEAKNPQRRKAWSAAQRLVLQPCEVCGEQQNVHRHHDDPSEPLAIMYLCALHHKQRHAMLKELVTA